jgi:hypothetical protein
MNHTRALPILFLLGSTAFSQTAGKQTPPGSVLKQFSSAALQTNCPIQLKASLYLVGETAGAEPIKNGRMAERDQRIYITLANPETAVASAQLTVHGFPVGGRVDPAVAYASRYGSSVDNNPAEIQKTIAFDRAVGTGQSNSIDVSVQEFSIVSSIDLRSVTYSDGSSWHPADHKYCEAIRLPPGALPIDGAVTNR